MTLAAGMTARDGDGRRGRSWTSAAVGIAVEHSSRDATMAPGDVGELRIAAQVPAAEQAVAQGAAEGVAGAEAVDDLDGEGRHLDPLVARGGEHALGALLDDRQLDARGRAARRRRASGRSRRRRPRTPHGCRRRRSRVQGLRDLGPRAWLGVGQNIGR